MRLQNKVALITGSSAGIGEATAKLFAREGARIMVHGLDKAEADGVAEQLKKSGATAAAFAGNIADPKVCEQLVAATVEKLGGLNILVNNAAIKTRDNIESVTVDVFDRTIAINLRAPLWLFKAALPHFRKAGGGSVINIGSGNGYCGERTQLSYSISKGGLMTLTRNLADAHGAEGIRVNQLNAGWVLTKNEYELKISEGMPADWPQKVAKVFAPSGSLNLPEEVAHFALMFCLPEGTRINGQILDLEQYPWIGRNPLKHTE
jgi:NAD(P)-dependent dehydrogenase (short-subunit alcohol dehydrogenase family)